VWDQNRFYKKNLKPEPESGVFIQVKNRSTLLGYSVPSGKGRKTDLHHGLALLR
jgi:hypothetical protein